MAKKNTVKFVGGDSPKPKKSLAGGVGLRSPLPLTIKPGATVFVDFGSTCDTTLLVGDGAHTKLLHGAEVVAAGKKLAFTIMNPLPTDLVFDFGDSLLNAYPVFSPEFEIE